MKKPNSVGNALMVPFLFVLLAGCEQIAIMPRPDIDRTTDLPRTASSRADLTPRDVREGDLWRSEMSASVDRVDEARRELYLRTSDGRIVVMRYDPRTQVISGSRDLSPSSLRYGDRVRVESTRRGDSEYADVIHIERMETGAVRY